MNNVDSFVLDLLHIDDVGGNRLLDLTPGGKERTYFLKSAVSENTASDILSAIRARIGKSANTVLRGSALLGEQMISLHPNVFDWEDDLGNKNPNELDKYIKSVYSHLAGRGQNPLFLSVGTLKWKLAYSKDKIGVATTPLLIFPIRLIRSTSTNPIAIEFIDEDSYLNPCFTAKLSKLYGEDIAKSFPHPCGEGTAQDTPISLDLLGDGTEYFERVSEYIKNCLHGGEDTVFEFDKNAVAISQYKHDEICMYYDIRRNRSLIDNNPLIEKLFSQKVSGDKTESKELSEIPLFIADYDSNQERMIKRVLSGESLIIKGPPGSGKTLTIVNMIATLLAKGKRVLMVSEKLAALSEIYNKLPAELRDFVLLLDSETEAEAAKLSPSAFKSDLKALLDKKAREPKLKTSVREDLKSAHANRSSAMEFLSDYYTENFSDGVVVGGSYFDALCTVMKNPDIRTVEFAAPAELGAMSRERYNELLSKVEELSVCFNEMSGNGSHSILLCPWYSFTGNLGDTEALLKLYSELAREAGVLSCRVKDALSSVSLEGGGVKLASLSDFLNSDSSPEDIIRRSKADGDSYGMLKRTLESREFELSPLSMVSVSEDCDLAKLSELVSRLKCDKHLKLSELTLLSEKQEILSRLSYAEEAVARSVISEMDKLYAEANEHRRKFTEVFRENLNDDEKTRLIKYSNSLLKYTKDDKKPRFFDFEAKHAYKQLSPLSYLSSVSFGEIAFGASELALEYGCKDLINEKAGCLERLFRSPLDDKSLDAAAILLSRAHDLGISASQYLECAAEASKRLGELPFGVVLSAEATVGDLTETLAMCLSLKTLRRALKPFLNKDTELGGDFGRESFERVLSLAKQIINERELVDCVGEGKDISDVANSLCALRDRESELSSAITKLLSGLSSAASLGLRNYYTEIQYALTPNNLDIFKKEALDRSLISRAEQYFAQRESGSEISLSGFFRFFESGARNRGKYSFAEIFEHSVFDLAASAYAAVLPERNGRGSKAEMHMTRFAEADEKIEKLNTLLVREACLSRIDEKDRDFAFVNATKDSVNSLRRIFKTYAEAILKLKKCYLVSPSTVSVLFESPAFSDFDVVITDEASQLEPTSLLPVLMRARQCVFVGDEWQMPPINHFGRGSEHTIFDESGEITYLPRDTSVLSLAINSNRFDVEQLSLHFRSKTESLISFSQGRYYPYMRTFPSPMPYKAGLGFRDIYVKDGASDGAVNLSEAKTAIAELKRHFELYFDEESGVLSESVGVVAFGEKQLGCIMKQLSLERELSAKISRAKAAFSDLPEKLIFFKTIQTVQGQEIDHMIISFTYGKGKDGRIREAYGDLGKGELGECIFNVAVTRARCSITMIHSVLPEEIDNPFIKSYLELCRSFGKGGREQFSMLAAKTTSFASAVAGFLKDELGIPEERIVTSCGVTKGSVRIPVAVLSPDQSEAQLGLFLEEPVPASEYIDRNIRYFEILKSRGWNLHRVFLHDWHDNESGEKEAIRALVDKYVTK